MYDLTMAMINLDAVELLGRVEYFDEDIARFPSVIEAHGLPFRIEHSVSENVGSPDFSQATQAQLSNFRSQVTAATWDHLLWLNEQDLTLWESVCARLDH